MVNNFDASEVAAILKEQTDKSPEFEQWRHEVELKIVGILGFSSGPERTPVSTAIQSRAADLLSLFECNVEE